MNGLRLVWIPGEDRTSMRLVVLSEPADGEVVGEIRHSDDFGFFDGKLENDPKPYVGNMIGEMMADMESGACVRRDENSNGTSSGETTKGG